MTRPTKYDDDGVRAKAEKRPEGLPIDWWLFAMIPTALIVVLVVAAFVHDHHIDTLERRIDYDRAREVERFNHASEMRAGNLNLIGRQIDTFKLVRARLDRVNLDHHRACQRAADLRGAVDFYGRVRFFGDVEFIPEEE